MTTTLASPSQAATFDLGGYLTQFNVDALVRSADYRRAVSAPGPARLGLSDAAVHHHAVARQRAGSGGSVQPVTRVRS